MDVNRASRRAGSRWGREDAGPGSVGLVRASYAGDRFVLGYGSDFFGIWDREAPGGPVERFARTDAGWEAAWRRFTALEPNPAVAGPAAREERAAGFRSARRLGLALSALLAVAALITVADMAFRVTELASLYRARAGHAVPAAETVAIRTRLEGASAVGDIVSVATGLLWLVWQYRAATNLRALGVRELRYSPAWAVGWWLIPVANLVMPYLTVRELYRASDPDAGATDWRRPVPFLLPVWWAAWILPLMVGAAGLALSSRTSLAPSAAIARDWWTMAGSSAAVAGAMLSIALVRGIGRRQERRRERMTAVAPAPAGAAGAAGGAGG